MSRAERLLELLQLLRSHRYPVSGLKLAADLGISIRTLYRDINVLQGQGAKIDGEPGLGYVLRPGFMLPPLMFSEEELEAIILGSQWVADRADNHLATAARAALVKIGAVLPADLRQNLDDSALLVGPGESIAAGDAELVTIRKAIRAERKLSISYVNAESQESSRIIWPIALGFFDRVRIVVAWCEQRQAFRHFRTDRIKAISLSDVRYPRRRQVMLKEWREIEGISKK